MRLPRFACLFSCMAMLVTCAATAQNPEPAHPSDTVVHGTPVKKQVPMDLLLVADVVSVIPRSKKTDKALAFLKEMAKKSGNPEELSVGLFNIIPRKFFISRGSLLATAEEERGKLTFDEEKLKKAVQHFRELLETATNMPVLYEKATPLSKGKRVLLGITIVPGFAYYGVPDAMIVTTLPPEIPASIDMEADYPKELKFP